jgi:uncharacterized protein YjbJ (UPF0337 family)
MDASLYCCENPFKIMNTTEVKWKWNEQKSNLKQKYANLTDDDLMFAEGKKDVRN